jgi:A/G-specific adenine glycosylase
MSPAIDAKRASRTRRRLLTWYDRHQRDLPWRRTRDPYAVWLSEMMLQQTQVATVIPYYERFIARFPTAAGLAKADLDDVLKLWAGLGYYARARNMHRAAQIVLSRFAGKFPTTVDELRTLPGVGAYSAGAVASIAFGVRAAAVDGNVARVLARLFNVSQDVRAGPGRDAIERLAERLLPKSRSGDFNQALMELGATVCLPGQAAQCLVCPLHKECKARAAGTVADLPIKTRKPTVKPETHIVAAVERNGRWLVVQRPPHGLWGGLWEMPTGVLDGESTAALAARLARDAAGSNCKVEPRPFCDLRHLLTHRTIRFIGHVCRPNRRNGRSSARTRHRQKGSPVPPIASQWRALDDLDSLGISKAMRKVIRALRGSATA